jgi:hypothetical protein
MNPTELKQSLGPPNMTPKADSRTTDFLFQEFHFPDVTSLLDSDGGVRSPGVTLEAGGGGGLYRRNR